ncbi:helix-turn-helix transcriptional regulator [Nocardia sp. No.11]|uniref:PadR family transcriptional regulator n=1 Tax=Nocardia sp. No.11 TaxID=3128861 RepID=UPI00319DABC1
MWNTDLRAGAGVEVGAVGQPGRNAMTPLAIAVLALLDERPMHPYEMYQVLMARREDLLVKVRPGSLYHVVARLAADELVRAEGTEREGNRPERTTYRITDIGRDTLRGRITDLLRTPVQEFPIFRVALAEAHTLPSERVVTLLRERAGHLGEALADVDAMIGWARAHDTPRRYWFVLEYIQATIQAELTWIEGFAADVDGGLVEWEKFDPETGERRTDDAVSPHEWPPGDHPDAAPRPRWAAGAARD